MAIHPSSVLCGKKAECIVFNELVRTSRQYARDVVQVDSNWLPELAPAFFARQQANEGAPRPLHAAAAGASPGLLDNGMANGKGPRSMQQPQQLRQQQQQKGALPPMANGIGPGARGTYRPKLL